MYDNKNQKKKNKLEYIQQKKKKKNGYNKNLD